MDTLSAFAMGAAHRRDRPRVFDWNKAAEIIRDRRPTQAGAGLSGDWEYTGGTIFADGQPVTDSYTYLSSTWATPELEIDGETIDCWVWLDESPGWDSGTKWTESALAILQGSEVSP